MMRLFARNKMYQVQDSLKTITEEPVLLIKVGPLIEEHPPTTQPIIPTPQKGGSWAIKQLLKKKKGRYNVTIPLITNKEDNVVLLRVNPITGDHPPTTQPIIPTPQKGGCGAIRQLLKKKKGRYNVKDPLITNKEENVVLLRVNPITGDRQPEDTAPPRGEGRAIGRGVRAALARICPFYQPKSTEDNTAEEINDPITTKIQPTTRDGVTIESDETQPATNTEDKTKPVVPISSESEETQLATNTEDKTNTVVPISSESEETQPATHAEVKKIPEVPITSEGEETQPATDTEDKKIPEVPITSESGNTPNVSFTTPIDREEGQTLKPSAQRSDQLSFNSALALFGLTPDALASVPSSGSVDPRCELSLESFNYHEMLGFGAFGKVVLASHYAMEQQMAIKIVKKISLKNDFSSAVMEKNILEACIGSRFITHLFGSFQTETYLVFVMEFVSGGELWDFMSESLSMEKNTIRFITAEILCGLQFLHSHQIVHRDLKPENILLDGEGHIKIADFGMSVAGVTKSNRITGRVGTLSYMAPEVIYNQPYFTTADYFSLGVIVYEMALCENPFYDGMTTIDDRMMEIINNDPHYPEDMDYFLSELLKRLLCKDQEERTHLVSDIRRHDYFQGIDWADLEEGKSPSPLKSATMNKKPIYRRMKMAEFMSSVDLDPPIQAEDQKNFNGFSYMSESMRLQILATPSPPPKSKSFCNRVLACIMQ